VNGQFCPSAKAIFGRPFFQKFFGRLFFRKTSGRTPEYVPEEGSSGSYLFAFFKMLYFSNYLILINKLRYKIKKYYYT